MKQTAQERRALRQAVAKAQQRFWDALQDLERLSGVELKSGMDWIDCTEPTDEDVKDLLRAYEDK